MQSLRHYYFLRNNMSLRSLHYFVVMYFLRSYYRVTQCLGGNSTRLR
jgi:hypothetical protein